jgi:hypothetical protein
MKMNKKAKIGCGCLIAGVLVLCVLGQLARLGAFNASSSSSYTFNPADFPSPTPTPTTQTWPWPPMEAEDANLFLNIPTLQHGDLSHPYIKGKIVVMDKNGPDPFWQGSGSWVPNNFDVEVIDSICDLQGFNQYDCPQQVGGAEKLLAAYFSEVGTIIWVDCKEEVVGSYGSGNGYQTTCTVTVIDKAANRLVGEKTFPTTQPPNEIGCNSAPCSGCGSPPASDMAKYIFDLPRK